MATVPVDIQCEHRWSNAQVSCQVE